MVIGGPDVRAWFGAGGEASLQVLRVGFRGGAIAPLIDGCRESEVSREWLIGDTIYGSGMGSMP